jgi:hypothetical protein
VCQKKLRRNRSYERHQYNPLLDTGKAARSVEHSKGEATGKDFRALAAESSGE